MADLTQPVIEAVGAYQVLEDTDPIRAALGVAATADLDGVQVASDCCFPETAYLVEGRL